MSPFLEVSFLKKKNLFFSCFRWSLFIFIRIFFYVQLFAPIFVQSSFSRIQFLFLPHSLHYFMHDFWITHELHWKIFACFVLFVIILGSFEMKSYLAFVFIQVVVWPTASKLQCLISIACAFFLTPNKTNENEWNQRVPIAWDKHVMSI